jgi:hypothetical protein
VVDVVFNVAFYGYIGIPRFGYLVLGIGIVASGGDAQLQSWYLARGSGLLSTWRVEKGPRGRLLANNGHWDTAKECGTKAVH